MPSNEKVYAVLVEPHAVHTLSGTSYGTVSDRISEAIGRIGGLPYPAQYGRTGVYVLANDDGMFSDLPYNRWGVVGTFAVVSTNNRPLSAKRVEEVVADVGDRDGGYLDDASGVLCAFREAFREHGIPPSGTVPRGKRWFRE